MELVAKAEDEYPVAPILLLVTDDVIGVTKDQDVLLNNPEDGDRNPMGPLVFNNMEISMVYILSAEFQPTTSQPSFLDEDVVTEETTQVEFVDIE